MCSQSTYNIRKRTVIQMCNKPLKLALYIYIELSGCESKSWFFFQTWRLRRAGEHNWKVYLGHTRSCSWGFVTGSKTVKRRIIAVLDYWVHWVGLLQLKKELFHCLNCVVATQIYCNFFYLERKITVINHCPKSISSTCHTAVLKRSGMEMSVLDRCHNHTTASLLV